MEFLNFSTSAGPLGVVGQVHTDRRRPCLLAVNGSFPQKDFLHDLVSDFLGVNVVIVNLPGMEGVPWHGATPAELTKGLEEVATVLLRGLPIVAFGSSTGNLLALGLKMPNICHRIAVEPFLQTKDLWPFIANSRGRLKLNAEHAALPWMTQFFWNYFGIGETTLENRDYRYLLDNIAEPTDVVSGQLPLLPERSLPLWPSFTSAEDRAALIANPFVTFHEGHEGSGHGVQVDPRGKALVKRLVEAALRAAIPLC